MASVIGIPVAGRYPFFLAGDAICSQERGDEVLALLLYNGALVGLLLLLFRLRGKLRCLGWLIVLACLIGFLYLISMPH
jgi:hypothetical protein